MAERSALERRKPRQENQKFKVILGYSLELTIELPHILSSYAISKLKEEGREMERAGTQGNGQEMPSFDHGRPLQLSHSSCGYLPKTGSAGLSRWLGG